MGDLCSELREIAAAIPGYHETEGIKKLNKLFWQYGVILREYSNGENVIKTYTLRTNFSQIAKMISSCKNAGEQGAKKAWFEKAANDLAADTIAFLKIMKCKN